MQILSFIEDVTGFLRSRGIEFASEGNKISFPSKPLNLILVPLETQSPEETGKDTVFLYEDRWKASRSVTSQRLLARLGHFRRIHARLSKVVSLENCKDFGLSPDTFRSKAKKFLDAFHTYGYLKGQEDYLLMYKEDIIAAAQFMKTYLPAEKDTKNNLAYEWTRYASLPDVRIAGGMGKVLNQFLSDIDKHSSPNAESTSVKPQAHGTIEVMSYSDNEWSNGDAYRKLGFKLAGTMEPVTYRIDSKTWKRINPRQWAALRTRLTDKEAESYTTIQNQGSLKWVFLFGDGI